MYFVTGASHGVQSLNVSCLQVCFGFFVGVGEREHGSTAVTHWNVSQNWLLACICFEDALPCSLLVYRFKQILATLMSNFRFAYSAVVLRRCSQVWLAQWLVRFYLPLWFFQSLILLWWRWKGINFPGGGEQWNSSCQWEVPMPKKPGTFTASIHHVCV